MALMHFVQTLSLLGDPFTTARTFWILGFQRRLVRRWECEMLFPKPGDFPQMSHTDAITPSRLPNRPPPQVNLRRARPLAISVPVARVADLGRISQQEGSGVRETAAMKCA